MRLAARKWKFMCLMLTLVLCGSLSPGVVFADDESKTVPERDEQAKTLGMAKTETAGPSYSAAAETSAPNEEKRRALPAPLDPLFPGSEYLGSTPLSAQRHTKRTVDVRNGCTFTHGRANPCGDRSHSSRGANLALAQCAPARAAIPCLILNLIVGFRW